MTSPARSDPRGYRTARASRSGARQLLAAALTLFAHRPPDEVSLDDVAEAAGVSRPARLPLLPRRQAAVVRGGAARPPPTSWSSASPSRRPARPPSGSPGPWTAISPSSTSTTPGSARCCRAAASPRPPVRPRSSTRCGGPRPSRSSSTSARWHRRREPRLRMMVRTWIAAVEAASLIWLDEGKQPPVGELRDWLVDHLVALLTATATRDAETAARRAARAGPGGAGRSGRRAGTADAARRHGQGPSALKRSAPASGPVRPTAVVIPSRT